MMDVSLGLNVLLFASVVLAYTSPVQASQRLESLMSADHVVDAYNRGSRENAAFRLLEAESKHGEEGSLPLKFTIKETLCLKTEKQNLQKCNFKEDGLVKTCSASFEQDPPVLIVICDPVTNPTFRAKRSKQKRGRGDGTGLRLKKRKCQRGARCEKPVRTGVFTVLATPKEDTPVLNTKRFQDRNIDRNRTRSIGKKCISGNKCKIQPLRPHPGLFSGIQNYQPAAAEKKLLRPKRSQNTNGSSNGNRRKPTKTKCKAGNKCNKTKPINVGIGGYSAIASPLSDSEVV